MEESTNKKRKPKRCGKCKRVKKEDADLVATGPASLCQCLPNSNPAIREAIARESAPLMLAEEEIKKDVQKVRQANLEHLPSHSNGLVPDRCKVCASPARSEIEEKYIGWEATAEDLADQYGLPHLLLLRHFRARNLIYKRVANTFSLHLKVQEEGKRVLNAGIVDPDVVAKLAVDSAKHMDKMEGRIVQKHDVAHQGQLQVVAPPLPGGAPGSEQDDIIQEAEVLNDEPL